MNNKYLALLLMFSISLNAAEEIEEGPERMEGSAPSVSTGVVTQSTSSTQVAPKATDSICSQNSILYEVNRLKSKEPEELQIAKKKYDDLLRKYVVAKEFEQIFNNYNQTIKEIKESEKDPTSALGKINHLEEVGDQIEFASKLGSGFEKYDPSGSTPTAAGEKYGFLRSQLMSYRVNDFPKDHDQDLIKLKNLFKELKLCAADCTKAELDRVDTQRDFLTSYLEQLNAVSTNDLSDLKNKVKEFDVTRLQENREGLAEIKKSLEIYRNPSDIKVLKNLKEVRKNTDRNSEMMPLQFDQSLNTNEENLIIYNSRFLDQQISELKISPLNNPFYCSLCKEFNTNKNQIIKMYKEKQKELDTKNKAVLSKFGTSVFEKLSSIPDSDTDPYNKFFKDIFKNDSCKKDKKEDSDHQVCSDLILDKIIALKDGGNWDLEKLKKELDSAKKEIEKLNARPIFGENGKAASYNDSLRNYFTYIKSQCGQGGLDQILKSPLNDQQRLSCSLGMCNDTQSFVAPDGDSGLRELMRDNQAIATYIEDENNQIDGNKAQRLIENDCQMSETFCGKIAQNKAMSQIRSDYVATWVEGENGTPGQYIYRDKKMGFGGFMGAFAMGGLQNMTQPGGLFQTYLNGYNLNNQMHSIWNTDLYRYQTNQYMLNSYNNMFAIPSYGGNPSGYIPGFSYFQNNNPYLYYNPISN